MNTVDAPPRAALRPAVRAGLLAGGVFLLVFVVLSLILLNLATPWIEDAGTVQDAARRLLWMLVPVLLVDAVAGLAGATVGARSARRSGHGGRPVLWVAVAPPMVVAAGLAAVGASDPTQTVYDLLAVGGGAGPAADAAPKCHEIVGNRRPGHYDHTPMTRCGTPGHRPRPRRPALATPPSPSRRATRDALRS